MFFKTAVTDPISSPRTSTAGSGPPPSPPCRPPTPAAPSTTGHTRAAWGCLSQTTGRRLSSTGTRSPAWPSSTTTTETVRSPCVVMTNDSDIFWCLVFNKRLAHYCVRRGEHSLPRPLPRPLLRPPLTPLLQASSGTTWPAHTRSPSSARTWTATSPTPGSTSLRSEYLETSHYSHGCLGRSQSRKTIYLWDLG